MEHFWSVSWDLRAQEPLSNTVITFPAVHITHEWGTDAARHGFALPNTLVHGVVERVFRTTIGEAGTVVGARFRPGGFAARFGRDAVGLTGRIRNVVRTVRASIRDATEYRWLRTTTRGTACPSTADRAVVEDDAILLTRRRRDCREGSFDVLRRD